MTDQNLNVIDRGSLHLRMQNLKPQKIANLLKEFYGPNITVVVGR